MGRGPKRAPRGERSSFRGALLSKIARSARTAQRRVARSRVAVPRPDASARRAVVKVHVARLGAGGAKAAALHLRYIERAGVEKDGSKGVAYAADGPARVETFEQPRAGERHQFRFILSPEDAAELDLTAYVRRFMGSDRARSRSQARMVGRQSLRHRPPPRAPRDPRRRPKRSRAPARPRVHLERLTPDRAGDRDRGARATA